LTVAEGWRARLGTVRVRTTAGAVVVVGVALAIAGVGLVALLGRSLLADATDAAELRAEEVVARLEAGEPPDNLELPEQDDAFVQVIGRDGEVVASSPELAGAEPAADVAPGESVRVDSIPSEDDPFVIVAEEAETGDGDLVVLAGRSIDDIRESTTTVAGLLAVGIPLLVAVVGATTWAVVGRALRPVEAIRAEADSISPAELDRRVPQPATHDEIARLAATMNRMLDRLESARRRERRFVADASHELRSPIASIRQHAEVASAHPDRTTVPELAEVVLEEDVRMQRLVEDLLLLARADENGLVLRRRAVDLDDLVLEEATALRASTSLIVDTSRVSAGRVHGDETQLRRVIRNLAENAARHADRRVAFEVRENGTGESTLDVDDDGPGVPEAERERVFERFVRLDEARAREQGGSGLGLAIVAEIVAAHGGRVDVTDSPQGGARFTVRLPTPSEE
jgi:signal transduction histidine kinase